MNFFHEQFDTNQRVLGVVLGAMIGVFFGMALWGLLEWMQHGPSTIQLWLVGCALLGAMTMGGVFNRRK